MKNGLVLTARTDQVYLELKEEIGPFADYFVFHLSDHRDLKNLEAFSRLENKPIFPMVRLLEQAAMPLAEIINSAREFLETDTFYLKVFNEMTDILAFGQYIETLHLNLKKTSNTKLHVHVCSPASQWISGETKTSAQIVYDFLGRARQSVSPCWMVSNTELSMSVLKTEAFQQIFVKHLYYQFYFTDIAPVKPQWHTEVELPEEDKNFPNVSVLWNSPTFLRASLAPKPNEGESYVVDKEKISAWNHQNLTGYVTRKLYRGDTIGIVALFAEGRVGQTLQGDFVAIQNLKKV